MISSRNIARSVELCGRLLAALPLHDDEAEPRVNMFAYYDPEEGYVTIVVPRRAHRPSVYFAQGGQQRLVSPGAIDMAGLVITPRKDDSLAMTADEVMGMLREVAMSPAEVEEVVARLS
jgi:hypothetical protein